MLRTNLSEVSNLNFRWNNYWLDFIYFLRFFFIIWPIFTRS